MLGIVHKVFCGLSDLRQHFTKDMVPYIVQEGMALLLLALYISS